MIDIEHRDGSLRFSIRVSPRASRDAVGGVHDGALRVKTTAPPVDGAANSAILKLLANALRVSRSAVRIVAGETSKTKRVEVDGVSAEAIHQLA